MKVALGRAVVSAAGRPARGDADGGGCGSSTSRPGSTQADEERGAPARPARRLPARRRGGRLRRARAAARRGGPAAARPGRATGRRRCRSSCPLAIDDEPRVGRTSCSQEAEGMAARPSPATPSDRSAAPARCKDSCPAQPEGRRAVSDPATPLVRRPGSAARRSARPHAPTPEQARGHRGPAAPRPRRRRRRVGQDRDHGRPGRLAGRQRPRRARRGPRPHLHPQGGRRAERADRLRLGAARGRASGRRPGRTARSSRRRPRPSRPTTPTPGGSCASTACGSASSPAPAARRGGGLAARPRGRRRAATGRWTRSTRPSPPSRPRSSTSPASWPSTSSAAPALAAHLDDVVAALEAAPKGEGPRKRADPMLEVRRRPAPARGGACCRWSSATRRASAPPTPSTSATRWRSPPGSPREVPQVGAPSAGGTGWCCSTSTRTPATASSAARALFARRGTGPGDRGRRPAPVDLRLARRRPPTTLDRFRDDFRDARARARCSPVDELAQRPRRPRRRQRVAAPLRRDDPGAGRAPLAERAAPAPGRSSAARLETIEDEARHVADWVAGAALAPPGRRTRQRCCAASGPSSTAVVEALSGAACPSRSSASAGCCTRRRSPTSSPCCTSCRTRPAATG